MAAAASLEVRFLALEAEFVRQSLTIPGDFINLLKGFRLKKEESAPIGRRRLYRRIFGILWYGNKVGKDKFKGSYPTYIYPKVLRDVVYGIIPDQQQDFADPDTGRQYYVTIEDLAQAKWPKNKK